MAKLVKFAKVLLKEGLTTLVTGVASEIGNAVGERIGMKLHPNWTRTQQPPDEECPSTTEK